MSEGAAAPQEEDCARAETVVPLDAERLFAFVGNIERLYRLNPHVEIEAWQATPGGFRLTARNEINEFRIETEARTEHLPAARSIVVRYEAGLKRATTIAVEMDGTQSRLVVTEHYPVIEDAQDPRLAEADRSLVPWVAAIHRHLRQRRRWGRIPGWHWWNERFLPGLPPRQRRIVRLIVWVSAIEFVLFLALVAVLVAAK